MALGDEGLMLHLTDSEYTTGRCDVLLKLKLQYDAEAIVIAHVAEKGKNKGKLGALLLKRMRGAI